MSRRGPASDAAMRSVVAGIAAPADRRFRRPDFRPVRRRTGLVLSRLWKPAAAAVLALAVVAGAGGVLFTTSALTIDRMAVRGHSRLSAADVEALVAGLRGAHILRVDLEEFRSRLVASSWIESAALRRVLPTTIEVRVVERVPALLARLGRQLYLMDGRGAIIDEFGPAYRDLDLPMVDGLVSSSAHGAVDVDGDRLRLTRRLLDALDARPDLGARVSQVNVANPRNAIVLLEDDAAYLHLGEEQFAERLQFYLEMVPTLGDQFRAIDYVDLRFDGRLFVRASHPPAPPVAKAGRRK